MPEIVVCIATYGRPSDLRRLLLSLESQQGLDATFGIAIADNHPSGSASSTADEFRARGHSIAYAIEPDPGIPAARNRSLQLAREMGAECVAFIDDDEVAEPYWLAAMYRRLRESNADAVSGPVEPIFPDSAPAWASASRLFHRPTFRPGQEIDYASTANSMLRLSAIIGIDEPFHPAFRFTGGSDSYLYHSIRARGGRIVWEPDGRVHEYVPQRRISTRWLMARSYRQGITLARCDRKIYGVSTRSLKRGLRGLAQIPAGALVALLDLVTQRGRWRHGLIRIARGAGSIAGLFGVTYQEYRRPADESVDAPVPPARNDIG